MEKNAEQLAAYLAEQSIVRRPVVKQADPGLQTRMFTAMQNVKAAESSVVDRATGAITSAGRSAGDFLSNLPNWANAAGKNDSILRHGAIGAGVGGLGTLLISKLMGRKWKDALWDALLGAGVGGAGGAGYELLSQTADGTAENIVNKKTLQPGRRITVNLPYGKVTVTVGDDGNVIYNRYTIPFKDAINAAIARGGQVTEAEAVADPTAMSTSEYAKDMAGYGGLGFLGAGGAGAAIRELQRYRGRQRAYKGIVPGTGTTGDATNWLQKGIDSYVNELSKRTPVISASDTQLLSDLQTAQDIVTGDAASNNPVSGGNPVTRFLSRIGRAGRTMVDKQLGKKVMSTRDAKPLVKRVRKYIGVGESTPRSQRLRHAVLNMSAAIPRASQVAVDSVLRGKHKSQPWTTFKHYGTAGAVAGLFMRGINIANEEQARLNTYHQTIANDKAQVPLLLRAKALAESTAQD